MKIGIAINNDVKYVVENVEHFETSSLYEGFDIVFNVVGPDLQLLSPQVVAKDMAKPTTSGILKEATQSPITVSLVDCTENGLYELIQARTSAGVVFDQLLPDELGNAAMIQTMEYDTQIIPFSVLLPKALKDLVQQEKELIGKNAKVAAPHTPVVHSVPGTTKFHITEQLKVIPNAKSNTESSATV